MLLLPLLSAAFLAQAPVITRGPVVSLATDSSITVEWRTDVPSEGSVLYGESALDHRVRVTGGTQHVATLSGLHDDTRYRYVLEVEGWRVSDPNMWFQTYPARGASAPVRFVAFGDSGNRSPAQMAVAQRLRSEVGEPRLGLILGDIVYPGGQPDGWDARFFRPYADLLRRWVMWPTPGNHDVRDYGLAPYRDAFQVPTLNPEHDPLYYSFDCGNVHFLSLATDGTSIEKDAPQLRWAQQDLADSKATWKIVFFHKPPYTGGTHPDDPAVIESFVPVLEAANVDLVLSGHSHNYERSFLVHDGRVVDRDPARYDKSGGRNGTLYMVSGAGGQSGPLSNPHHRFMARQLGHVNGYVVIDVAANVLRGFFRDASGAAVDPFSIAKGPDHEPPALLGARVAGDRRSVELAFNEPLSSSATDPSHYAVGPQVSVAGVKLDDDRRAVRLELSGPLHADARVRVKRIADNAEPPNTLEEASTALTVPASVAPAGGDSSIFYRRSIEVSAALVLLAALTAIALLLKYRR